jgi:SAM-dependent methyltransferase
MSNDEQVEYWNGRAGEKWAAMQADLDVMLGPVADLLIERAGDVTGLGVLDIGCGTGVTSLALAARGAVVTGVDVSAPMLELAKERAGGKADFQLADAATWMAAQPLDLAFSRFGVMFFADPYAAFANIAKSLKPGGRLLFACWRPVAENDWVKVPMGAIRDLLPEAPPPDPLAPGPFAFADPARVEAILSGAGFSKIAIVPHDVPITIAQSGGATQAARFVMQIGPAGAALAESDQTIRAEALTRLEVALAPFVSDGVVSLKGAVWLVEAVRG